MSVQIPTSTTLSDYRQTTTLDGRDYILRFLFNQREATWFLSVFDEQEDPIVEGVKIVANWPLLRLVQDARAPAGVLFAFDTTAPDAVIAAGEKTLAEDPGLGDLGERVILTYFTRAEIDAL